METERSSHIPCVCVALAAFRFLSLGKHFFLWNQATVMRFRHVRDYTLSEVRGLLAEY
jgi:hypothetical protein